MFKTLSILFLSLILVGCATNKASFDVKTQTVAYKDLSSVKAPEGDPVIIALYYLQVHI